MPSSPLSPPPARERLHTRRYRFDGYERVDGLWDIEARLTDVKTYGFANAYRGRIEADEPLHDMWIRLTLDDELTVRDIEAVTEAGPYALCAEVAPNFTRMIGTRIGPGWRKAIRERLGGVEGCTHLTEMLGAMATVAYQTLYARLKRKETAGPPGRRGNLVDSCYALRSDREVVKREWPEFYTGD